MIRKSFCRFRFWQVFLLRQVSKVSGFLHRVLFLLQYHLLLCRYYKPNKMHSMHLIQHLDFQVPPDSLLSFCSIVLQMPVRSFRMICAAVLSEVQGGCFRCINCQKVLYFRCIHLKYVLLHNQAG